MAGGTHADHSNVEAFLGVTFSATSKPFTDAQVDAMCVASEALIVSELEPGNSLPTSASTSWRQLVVMIVINMLKQGDQWHRVRGATTEGGEQDGTVSFAEWYAVDVITPAIRRRIKRLERALSGARSVRSGDLQ